MRYRIPRQGRFKRSPCASGSLAIACPPDDAGRMSMRHQPLLAKISFVCFLIGLVIALAACAGTRLHSWDFAFGTRILAPGLGFGILALICGIAWIWRALAMNNSLSWRLGGIGLLGSA